MDNWKRTYLDPDEQAIEVWVERQFDSLDRKYMAGKMTNREYDEASSRINAAADLKYHMIGKAAS